LAFCVLRVESGGRFQTCHLPFGIIQESELGIWRGFRFLWSWLSLGFGGWTEQRKGYVFLLLNLSSIDYRGLIFVAFGGVDLFYGCITANNSGLFWAWMMRFWVLLWSLIFEVLGFVWSFKWFFFFFFCFLSLCEYIRETYLVCRNSGDWGWITWKIASVCTSKFLVLLWRLWVIWLCVTIQKAVFLIETFMGFEFFLSFLFLSTPIYVLLLWFSMLWMIPVHSVLSNQLVLLDLNLTDGINIVYY
jgi:hypothetical protein